MAALDYDWNSPAGQAPWASLHDETLRDGVQCPSVVDPPIEAKIEILHLLEAVGVGSVNVGLPGAGPNATADALALCREIVREGMRIRPGCAARTVEADVAPIADISQRAGIKVEALLFIGSSPIRRFVERWSLDLVRERTESAVGFAVREGLPVTYVTEDTTRTPPDALRELFMAAIGAGASRLCLCDTVGHATPDGVENLIRFTRTLLRGQGVTAGIDWHGHDDRGLALANALVAMQAGADRVHGCVLGIGERVGNTSLEMLLLNLEARGVLPPIDHDVLARLCRVVATSTCITPRPGHPLLDRPIPPSQAPRSLALAEAPRARGL